MRKLIVILSIATLGCFLIQCTKDSPSSNNNPYDGPLNEVEYELVTSANKFGFNLFREINDFEPPGKNLFISPLSVSMALGMTWNGTAGETRAEMQEALELAGLTTDEVNESYRNVIELLRNLDPEMEFKIANSIWYRQGFPFYESYLTTCQSYFDAMVSGLDFNDPASVDIINGWVNEYTNGRIPTVINNIPGAVVMYLINAIYFNATWTHQFDTSYTYDDSFYTLDSALVPCKMMSQREDFRYLETSDFQAIDLPYGNGDFSMLIIFPKPDKDIDELIVELTPGNLASWIGSLEEYDVRLTLPKFTFKYNASLVTMLQALGMELAFTGNADFSDMSELGDQLFISDIIHKTFVAVHEKGTEAAAVTVVVIEGTSVPPPPDYEMYVNRPFLFMIKETQTQSIIFMGKLVAPVIEE
ncbi:serpin family protein [bacterium]|nr:serpin family protein [bacterium]